jgi:TRAP-type mannitol/chloroaromatic compound transport system substrate-binding protein
MQRRRFIAGAATIGAAAGAGSFPAPAIGQGLQEWRMVTSWPRNLPGPGIAAQRVADRITSLTEGRITVNVSAAGEIVPALGVFDAVAGGIAELYHSVPAYWLGKSQGIGFFGSYPFGLTVQERDGWLKHGGGQALYDEIYARFGLKPFNTGDSGPQWMGWFRQPITSIDDFRGLRYRTAGLGGEMYRRVGAAVQTIPGGEIFGALQAGTIDAAEFIGPWSDFPLGFHQVAGYYYWPGVQEPSSAEEIGVNLDVWNGLDDDLKVAIQAAADSVAYEVTTEYDTNHPIALRQLVEEHGVEVREAPEDLLIALGEAARELTHELLGDSDELVRRIAESYVDYRDRAADYARYSYAGLMNARTLTGPWR